MEAAIGVRERVKEKLLVKLFYKAIMFLVYKAFGWLWAVGGLMMLYYEYFVIGAVLLAALAVVLVSVWQWKGRRRRGLLADRQWVIILTILVAIVAVLVWWVLFISGVQCVKVDITDSRLPLKRYLSELKYKSHDNKVWTLNLVEELADGDKWEKVALVMGENPEVIYRNYVPHNKQVEYCKKLVRKIISLGYNGKFGWSAYIKAFKRTEGLNDVVRKLEDMLTCLNIGREALGEVTERRFSRMSCNGGTTLRLTEAIAPYWEEVADTFGIERHLISSDHHNIAEKCSRVVLEKLVDQGYGGSLGWQGIIRAVETAGVNNRLVATLKTALECVVTD